MRDVSSFRLPVVNLLLPLALAGCSGGMAAYPSLAQRPAERAFAQGPAPAPAPVAPGRADPATLHRIATLRADATSAGASFAQLAQEADHLSTAARGTGVGSEAWAAATVAMASLDSTRSDTALALAELDALQVKAAVNAADSNNPDGQATYVAVTDIDRAVAAILNNEDARIAMLHKTMEN
jgi:pyruvate/2-oxoglutarate dehydrogenase complex dihydrolipoamide acyltransferase (E2) component